MEAKNYSVAAFAVGDGCENSPSTLSVDIGKGLAEKIIRLAKIVQENELANVTQFLHMTWKNEEGEIIRTELDEMHIHENCVIFGAVSRGGAEFASESIELERLKSDFGLEQVPDAQLKDGDYELADGAGWLGTKNFSVRVRESEEKGIFVDVYPRGKEAEDSIASAHADVADDPKELQWLILRDEETATYTNFGDGRPGDASELVEKVNADPALNQGKTDWRLPSIDELKTLFGTDQDPKCGWYWSASPHANGTDNAWYVYFTYGYGLWDSKAYAYRVRLVRSGQ